MIAPGVLDANSIAPSMRTGPASVRVAPKREKAAGWRTSTSLLSPLTEAVNGSSSSARFVSTKRPLLYGDTVAVTVPSSPVVNSPSHWSCSPGPCVNSVAPCWPAKGSQPFAVLRSSLAVTVTGRPRSTPAAEVRMVVQRVGVCLTSIRVAGPSPNSTSG